MTPTKREELAEDLAAADAAVEEAKRDLAEVDNDPPSVPVGPSNEEAAEAAAGSIQIGG